MDQNPYAPIDLEDADLESEESYHDGLVFRDGGRMVLRQHAAIPPICLATGKSTDVRVKQNASWHPFWIYWLLLPGLLPYVLVAPFFTRQIELQVPVAKDVYRSHMRKVKTGLALTLSGFALVVIGLPFVQLYVASRVVVIAGLFCLLLGFAKCSRQPVPIHIDRLEGETLYLRDVHQNCLAALPDWGQETSKHPKD